MRSSWSDPDFESALIAVLRPAAVPAGAADRMLAGLPQGIPAVPLWRRRPVRYALALVAAAVLVVLGASPQARDAVANTVQQIFYFLPGQGIRGASSESLVLAQPSSVTRDGVTLRVVSVLADGGSVTVAYEATGLPAGKSADLGSTTATPAYLVDASGHPSELTFGQAGEGGTPGAPRLYGVQHFAPLRPGVRSAWLVIDSSWLGLHGQRAARLGTWRVPFTLETPAHAKLRPADLSANVVTRHGVSLRLDQVDRTADRTVAHVSGFGARFTRIVTFDLTPPIGPDTIQEGAGLPNQWDIQVPASTQSLRFDRLNVVESGEATVTLNLAAQGSFELNIPVSIGRYRVVLDREEWVAGHDGRDALRIYFHSGPAVDGGRIEAWEMDGVSSYGFAWPQADSAGGYLELPDPTPGHTVLRIKNPVIAIDGPWVLPLNAS